MNTIQIVTALHGNEYMPTLAVASTGISQIVGNPRALAIGKRFVDADLNGVFGAKGKGYEYKRSEDLLKLLNQEAPVVDFHTFSAESDPFAIFVDKAMLPFAKKTGIKKLIFMKKNFKNGRALINHIPGVSVEVGTHTSKEAFDTTLNVLSNVLAEEVQEDNSEVYEVFDIITEPGKYENFSLYNNDFYPVLAGSNPYDFYGLKAKKIELV
ncbi:hypothetical protein C5B42_04385 [Candidatus Cerribacteria bacterium 'Amazon FNV 2010 28 9']|uniref:Succinylglutamate desuccinylase/Aspartoacylase catalytic domain-containing protein n=1 Tax=Candidatus Cerribacteria bacterium 'Amazon FNV 2010 28 9' TaxID=2081795 RepID=A0A317JPB5_9BACT|nr:MAG: hypothetical protein C5B42_04385 [Candidatus Cerribacteria bacterium 'Amazon FNV 2010 28 9']